jgi:3-dehydroquinate synthetase
MHNLYSKILNESVSVDDQFKFISEASLSSYELVFNVPFFHPRSHKISQYSLRVSTLSKKIFNDSQLIFVDKGLEGSFLKGVLPPSENIFFEEAREETFKEWNWLNNFIKKNGLMERKAKEVVGIGGGLTLNVAAYVAELLNVPLMQVPTTVIGMADGSGGKVRINMIDRGRFFKHYYKSFYEPNVIILDPRFLDTLSKKHISIGLGEIIKHGIYQSKALLDFLLSPDFDPYTNKKSLLKAILWTASLKAVCLKIDVEENANGSRKILRGGHEISDRIEEDTHFEIPHGLAVVMGIYREMELSKHDLLSSFIKFCDKFGIPKSIEEFNRQ